VQYLFFQQFLKKESELHYFQGIAHISERKWSEAKASFDAAWNQDEGHIWVALRQVQVGWMLGSRDGSDERLKKLVDSAPFYADARLFLGTLMLFQAQSSTEVRDGLRMLDLGKKSIRDKPLIVDSLLKAFEDYEKIVEGNATLQELRKNALSQPVIALLFLRRDILTDKEKKVATLALQECVKKLEVCSNSIDKQARANQHLWALPEDPIELMKQDLLKQSGRAR